MDLVTMGGPAVELDIMVLRALGCLARVFRAVHLVQSLNFPSIMAAVAAVLAARRTVPESVVWASSVRFLGRLFITQAEVQRAPMTWCLCQADSGEGVPAVRDL
jgi:hypothetical protein